MRQITIQKFEKAEWKPSINVNQILSINFKAITIVIDLYYDLIRFVSSFEKVMTKRVVKHILLQA